MSGHPHRFGIGGAGKLPAQPASNPSSSSSSSSSLPAPSQGLTGDGRVVQPLEAGDARASAKRRREDSEQEREVAEVAGQDKKAKCATPSIVPHPTSSSSSSTTSSTDTPAQAFVRRHCPQEISAADRVTVMRTVLAAALQALPRPSGRRQPFDAHKLPAFTRALTAIVVALGERLGLAALSDEARGPLVEAALLAWAARTTCHGGDIGEASAYDDAVILGLLRGVATALAGDEAQRFDHALIDIVRGFARSPALAAQTGQAWSSRYEQLLCTACDLLRSTPAPTARLLHTVLENLDSPGHAQVLTTSAMTLLVGWLLDAPGGTETHRANLSPVILARAHTLSASAVGGMLQHLTQGYCITEEPALVRQLADFPGLYAHDRGLSLLVGFNDDFETLEELSDPTPDDIPRGVVAALAVPALLDAAKTPERRMAVLTCLLATRQCHDTRIARYTQVERQEAEQARDRYLASRAAGDDTAEDPGPFNPETTFECQFDAALCAGIARVAGDCSQAQLIELVHRHALGVGVPDPVTDPDTFERFIAARMPPVPTGESKAESAARHFDRTQRRGWIATGLLLKASSPTAVARLDGLTRAEQVRLFEAAYNDGPYDPGELQQLLDAAPGWPDTPPALKAAIVHRALMVSQENLTPALLRTGRERLVALGLQGTHQSLDGKASADTQAVHWAVEMTELMQDLLALYRGYTAARGLDALLAAPRPLAQDHLQQALALSNTLRQEFNGLRGEPLLWARVKDTLGQVLQGQLSALAEAIEADAPTPTASSTTTRSSSSSS